jgi:cytoskeletal protein CcmA (bactofilin family)
MRKTNSDVTAFLGRDTNFEGKLSFNGSVRLDGRFKGQVKSDGTLIAGETAVIEAEVEASHIIVSGEIHGDMCARDRIEIHAPAKVFGNVSAPVVIIDEGVLFEGCCQMKEVKKESKDNRKGMDIKPTLTEVKK